MLIVEVLEEDGFRVQLLFCYSVVIWKEKKRCVLCSFGFWIFAMLEAKGMDRCEM